MNCAAVDVLLFHLNDHRLAVELHLVSSVLAPAEAKGMRHIDPRPHLLAADDDPDELCAPKDERFGLLALPGPPTAILLGEVLGAGVVTPADLVVIPPWLTGCLPEVVRPACTLIDQKVVWLLDLDTLESSS